VLYVPFCLQAQSPASKLDAALLARTPRWAKAKHEAADALLVAGAEVDAADQRGMTPLMACLEYLDDQAFADFLLKRGWSNDYLKEASPWTYS
jgi:hypothetical protein